MSNDSTLSVEGEIDARFGSYYDPEKHGTMNNGTTVAASDDGEQGTVEYDNWPSEAPDPDSLTEKQRRTIELAVSNPTTTASAIDDEIGSQSYANSILKKLVPEWYENVFKKHGASGDWTKRTSSETADNTSGDSEDSTPAQEESDDRIDRAVSVCEGFEAVLDGEGERVAKHIKQILTE